MGNILITDYCNRACKYCFAQNKITQDGKGGHTFVERSISPENLEKALDFLRRSSASRVGLLGGEPTLHPGFPDVIDAVLAAGFRIKLFSNGLMPPAALDRLVRAKPGEILTIVNVNHPDETSASEQTRTAATLEALGERAALGFNIHRPDFDGEFLIDLTDRYGLDPHIRLGLAQPILGGRNVYVRREDYREVGRRLIRLAEMTGRHGFFLGLDCGFTLCMFDRSDIGPMIYNGVTFRMLCNPIIDINVDLSVWCCFPLSMWETTHLDQFENRNQAVQYYDKKLKPFRDVGSTAECMDCRHKAAGNCRGGCVAHSIAAFYNDPANAPALEPLKGAGRNDRP